MPVPVCLSGPCRAPPRRRCSSARPHHRLPGPYRSSDRATPRSSPSSLRLPLWIGSLAPRLVSPRLASPRLASLPLTSPQLLPCHAASHAYILILSSFSAPSSSFLFSLSLSPSLSLFFSFLFSIYFAK